MSNTARISILQELRDQNWKKQGGWTVSLSTALEGVSAAEAAWQPRQGEFTIWQLVNHINFWNERFWRRLNGNPPGGQVDDNVDTFGLPGNPADEGGWNETLAHTRTVAENLDDAFAKLTDEDLERPMGDSTLENQLTSWIMHDAYHSGQIVLLRKLQGAWSPKL